MRVRLSQIDAAWELPSRSVLRFESLQSRERASVAEDRYLCAAASRSVHQPSPSVRPTPEASRCPPNLGYQTSSCTVGRRIDEGRLSVLPKHQRRYTAAKPPPGVLCALASRVHHAD